MGHSVACAYAQCRCQGMGRDGGWDRVEAQPGSGRREGTLCDAACRCCMSPPLAEGEALRGPLRPHMPPSSALRTAVSALCPSRCAWATCS